MAGCVAGCGNPQATPTYSWNLPTGFPTPLVPDENPMTADKVALGRRLFYEKRLSGNQAYACSSCHQQKNAFTDGNVTPIGSTGHQLPRNSMSLVNGAYNNFYMWANPLLSTLEEQALVPMFSDAPVEMGMTDVLGDILTRIQQDTAYPALFKAAYPSDEDPVSIANIVAAISCFERTMISGTSPYDRFEELHDTTAMSDSAQRGLAAFNGERFDCYHCHAGTTFTTSFVSANSPKAPRDFRNTGLYNLDGNGAYPPDNTGLFEFTGIPNDMGKFKIPTLRNVELTAPYFHDGSAATLEEVLEVYGAGGRDITSGPDAGDGTKSPHRDALVKGIPGMTDQEKQDMIEFLKSLTDTAFINDPQFGNPDCSSALPTECPASVPSYASDVKPILDRSCTPCHSAGNQASARPFDTLAGISAYQKAAVNQVSVCNMPPPTGVPLDDGDRITLLSWLLCGAPNN